MKILVIGNGFDLAHELPTSYNDFLEFCRRVKIIFENVNLMNMQFEQSWLKDWKTDSYIKNCLKEAFEKRTCKGTLQEGGEYLYNVTVQDSVLTELYTYIKHNTWLEYFWNCPSYVGKNWIDFEAEISKVIQAIEAGRFKSENEGSIMGTERNESIILTALMKAAKKTLQSAFGDVRAMMKFVDFLYSELEKLIRALEIYIAEFVSNIKIEKVSGDIMHLNPNHILSFNYSNTYERVYGEKKEIAYDYIHGKADICNTLETNDMVLGIDEYLKDDKKDSEIDFIAFKKYYQRLYKQSKRLTEVWCAAIKKEAEYEKNSRKFMLEEQIGYELVEEKSGLRYSWQDYEKLTKDYEEQYDSLHPKHEVYIFGHSLDVTDKDILRNLILNDNVHTTIFYCKKKDSSGNYDNGRKDRGEKIANLVKVIGQNELIKRTGGATKTIEFKLQQDMIIR